MSHYVIGDTHGKYELVEQLMNKIDFKPTEDFAYFLGDYFRRNYCDNKADSAKLLKYLNEYYQPDPTKPGFHLLKGNHEWKSRHLKQVFGNIVISALPDIVVLRISGNTFCLSHSGMNKVLWAKIKKQLPDNITAAEFFLSNSSLPCYNDVVDERGQNGHTFKDKDAKTRAEYWVEDLDDTFFFHGHLPDTVENVKGEGEYCYKRITNDAGHGNVRYNPLRHAFNIDTGAHGGNGFAPAIACICLEKMIDKSKNKDTFSADSFIVYSVEE